MKKYFYSIFAATTMLMAASCSQDEELVSSSNGNEEVVTFTVNAGVVTRAAGDGNTVNMVHYEVWDKNTGTLVISTIDGSSALTQGRAEGVSGGRATVSMSLVKGVPYDITFWAQHEEGSAYDISAGLDNITLKSELLANKEQYDAFFKTLYDFKVSEGSTTVELKRPFAQVNVGTTPADWERANALGVGVNQSTVTVSGVHNQFNARTAVATGETSVTFALNTILSETFTAADSTYQYLAMNYLLADSAKTIHDMEVTFNDGETEINTISVANMPIQRNWRTNIVGRVLTSDEDFIIIIDPEFEGEYNRYIGIQEPVYDEATSTYTITNAAELAWVANEVNVEGNNFAKKTVVLANDIDLAHMAWTPICDGSEGCAKWFNGTFDGQGKTIKNLNVEVEGTRKPAGLFGKVLGKIQNLNVDGAKVVGFGQNGVIAGGIYGSISNCTVTNAEVTANVELIDGTYDNGDKVGAIVGQVWEGNYSITGCTVSNTTLKAYRDAGTITGCLTTGSNHTQTVTGNTVGENVVIIIDQSATPYAGAPKDPNAGHYVGSLRGNGNFVVENNTGEAVIQGVE